MTKSSPALMALLANGAKHLREGGLAEAIAAFSEVVQQDPSLADAWFNLAWAQRADRRFGDAIISYEHAIAFGVERPEEAHLNRAVIYSDHLYDPELAKAELHAALLLNPEFLAGWLNLGAIQEDLGLFTDARSTYERVLAIDPASGCARARIAAIDLFDGNTQKAIADLHAALEIVGTLDGRADILFGLGDALDAAGVYDEAFTAYEAANVIANSCTSARYDALEQEALIDRLIATFPNALRSPVAPIGSSPIFICGMFRSGSTLAEQQLARRHHGLTSGGELEFIPALARRLAPYPEAATLLTREENVSLRARYVAEKPVGGRVIDKRCDNFLHIGLILTLFPDARIIHTVRQPLDNIISIYSQRFGDEIIYDKRLDQITHYYIQYRRLMSHWERIFPQSIYRLDYDTLVVDPNRTLTDALMFLNLVPSDLEAIECGPDNAVRTPSTLAVRKPVHRRSSGRWRNYEPQLHAARALLVSAEIEI